MGVSEKGVELRSIFARCECGSQNLLSLRKKPTLVMAGVLHPSGFRVGAIHIRKLLKMWWVILLER